MPEDESKKSWSELIHQIIRDSDPRKESRKEWDSPESIFTRTFLGHPSPPPPPSEFAAVQPESDESYRARLRELSALFTSQYSDPYKLDPIKLTVTPPAPASLSIRVSKPEPEPYPYFITHRPRFTPGLPVNSPLTLAQIAPSTKEQLMHAFFGEYETPEGEKKKPECVLKREPLFDLF